MELLRSRYEVGLSFVLSPNSKILTILLQNLYPRANGCHSYKILERHKLHIASSFSMTCTRIRKTCTNRDYSYLFNLNRFSKKIIFSSSLQLLVYTRRFKKLLLDDPNKKTLSSFLSLYFQIIYSNSAFSLIFSA